MPDAILIAGPTASGKSGAALALAARLNGTIINADSMQVYKELPLLTAQPSAADMATAPHRLFGYVPASEACSVGRWLDDAASAIADARSEGRIPILTGGTGLYFLALLEGLSPVPDIPADIRQHWREQGATLSATELHDALRARDAEMAARLKPTDTQRIVRALEVVEATGVSLADWQETKGAPLIASDGALKIVIAPERDQLYANIDARFEAMLHAGAMEEVQAFAACKPDPDLPLMRAHGVRELMAYLRGALTFEEATEKAKTESRRYAKRQMTWARRFMGEWTWMPSGTAAIAELNPLR